jgi:nucleotide-binding universal stress UspA family protein
MNTLRTILVPIDGSAPSLAALDHAVTLASDYNADVEVLHVMPEEDPMSAEARAEVTGSMQTAVDIATNVLGDRLGYTMVVGEPVREIIDAASDGIDLIVIGTHGRVGRLHSMLGSIAEGVVRNAPCPVLTVRDQTEGYQGFAERRHHRETITEQAQHHEA